MDWYYTNGRSKHGPIDEEGIRLRAQRGYVRRDTLLWNETMPGWKRADELGFFPEDDAEPTMCIPLPSAKSEPPPIPSAASGAYPTSLAVTPPGLPATKTPSSVTRISIEPFTQTPASAANPAPTAASSAAPAGIVPATAPEPSAAAAPAFAPQAEMAANAAVPMGAAAIPAASVAAPASQAPIQVNVAAPIAQNGEPVSVSNWFWTIFAMAIPFVNIILLLVFAFGDSCGKSKSNWAKAILLWFLVGILLAALFWGSLIGALAR